jgi:membrane fusion protein (multidrug efflux system)
MKKLKVVTLYLLGGFIVTNILISGGCKGKKQNAQSAPAKYTVQVVERSDITVYAQFPTQIQSEDAFEIYSRATGYIKKIYVKEGDNVKKGSSILKIDDIDYLQVVNSTKAAYDNARLEVTKLEPLVKEDIISPLQLQTAQSNADAAKAAYENAKINLGFTLITSPVSGVIGRITLREGSLLTAGITTPITDIASNGDVFAYFSFDEKRLLEFVSDSTPGSLQQKVTKLPPAELLLATGQIYDHTGKIELGSSLVDPSTGSLQLKGVFPNPQALLRSGSTGTIRLPSIYKNAIVVPQKATYDIQDKKMIFTVDSGNVVHAVNITVANNTSDRFVIASGLNVGDKIVSDGIGKIKDGDKIDPIIGNKASK